MYKFKITAILSTILFGIGAMQVSSAHHSAVAFDKTKTQVVSGEGSQVHVWRNPHLSVTLDVVKSDSGGTLKSGVLRVVVLGRWSVMASTGNRCKIGDDGYCSWSIHLRAGAAWADLCRD